MRPPTLPRVARVALVASPGHGPPYERFSMVPGHTSLSAMQSRESRDHWVSTVNYACVRPCNRRYAGSVRATTDDAVTSTRATPVPIITQAIICSCSCRQHSHSLAPIV